PRRRNPGLPRVWRNNIPLREQVADGRVFERVVVARFRRGSLGTQAMRRALNVTALFAGIGGFELGLSRAGHETSLSCENDAEAAPRTIPRRGDNRAGAIGIPVGLSSDRRSRVRPAAAPVTCISICEQSGRSARRTLPGKRARERRTTANFGVRPWVLLDRGDA